MVAWQAFSKSLSWSLVVQNSYAVYLLVQPLTAGMTLNESFCFPEPGFPICQVRVMAVVLPTVVGDGSS